MNVIRAIYKSGKDKKYLEKLNFYKQYVTGKYNLVKRDLKTKEKIEFNLYMRLKPIYKLIVTRIERSMELVSVIIPVYNIEKYLSRCL